MSITVGNNNGNERTMTMPPKGMYKHPDMKQPKQTKQPDFLKQKNANAKSMRQFVRRQSRGR